MATLTILSNSARCIAGKTEGMDVRIWENMRQGVAHPTARLDLHGHGEGDAWLLLHDFSQEALLAEHRCVIVIHGKGRGHFMPQHDPLDTHSEVGVLKSQISQRLAENKHVLAFHTAPPHLGGKGAILIWLRQR